MLSASNCWNLTLYVGPINEWALECIRPMLSGRGVLGGALVPHAEGCVFESRLGRLISSSLLSTQHAVYWRFGGNLCTTGAVIYCCHMLSEIVWVRRPTWFQWARIMVWGAFRGVDPFWEVGWEGHIKGILSKRSATGWRGAYKGKFQLLIPSRSSGIALTRPDSYHIVGQISFKKHVVTVVCTERQKNLTDSCANIYAPFHGLWTDVLCIFHLRHRFMAYFGEEWRCTLMPEGRMNHRKLKKIQRGFYRSLWANQSRCFNCRKLFTSKW